MRIYARLPQIELKKKYLYEEDPIKRAITLLEQLKEEIALAKIENEIEEILNEEVDASDLEEVSSRLSELNYYNNTNK